MGGYQHFSICHILFIPYLSDIAMVVGSTRAKFDHLIEQRRLKYAFLLQTISSSGKKETD